MAQKQIEINGDCQFIKDLESPDNNNRNYNMGKWNLACSIRDLKLFCKGIKPNRHWKFSPLNEYFGMTGSRNILLSKLVMLDKVLKGEI